MTSDCLMENATAQFNHRHAKRNFRLTAGNGAIVMMGMSFIAPETVIAWLVHRLTASPFWVGVAVSLFTVGMMWPQLLVGSLVETVARKKPIYIAFAALRIAVITTIAALLFLWRGSDWGLFWLILALLFCFTSGGGVSVVPFMDVVAKAVPQKRIAMLWAYRRLFGGMLGFFSGFVVAFVLSDRSGLAFPANYGALFLLSAAVCAVAFTMFFLVREPVETVASRRAPFKTFLKRGPRILKHDHDFRRLYLYRWAWALSMMCQTQLVSFASAELNAPDRQAGWFTAVVMLVGGVASYGWGRVTLARGETYSLRTCALIMLSSPLMAFLMALAVRSPSLAGFLRAHYFGPFLLMFALGTIAINGNVVAGTPYLLSLPKPSLRPTYLAFINTLSVPLLFAPALAGFIIERFSYEAAFGVSCVCALTAAAIAGGLRSRRGVYPDLHLDEADTITSE